MLASELRCDPGSPTHGSAEFRRDLRCPYRRLRHLLSASLYSIVRGCLGNSGSQSFMRIFQTSSLFIKPSVTNRFFCRPGRREAHGGAAGGPPGAEAGCVCSSFHSDVQPGNKPWPSTGPSPPHFWGSAGLDPQSERLELVGQPPCVPTGSPGKETAGFRAAPATSVLFLGPLLLPAALGAPCARAHPDRLKRRTRRGCALAHPQSDCFSEERLQAGWRWAPLGRVTAAGKWGAEPSCSCAVAAARPAVADLAPGQVVRHRAVAAGLQYFSIGPDFLRCVDGAESRHLRRGGQKLS